MIGFGFLETRAALALGAVLILYFLIENLEKASLYFIRAVPFFIALPITAGFDSLNMWRILSLILLLKWGWEKLSDSRKRKFISRVKEFLSKLEFNSLSAAIYILFLIAVISLFKAPDFIAGAKRIIYFANALMAPAVIYQLVKMGRLETKEILQNIVPAAVIVLIIGFIQLLMTYFTPIDEFLYFWSLVFDKGFYGTAWSQIALKGNTWFAYFGETLSLRMFSTFPDSHSFPMFLLMSLISITALLRAAGAKFIKYALVLIPFYLGVILSGTRGMWLSSISLLIALWWFRKIIFSADKKFILGNFIIFILLFSIAYPILASPQFQIFKEDPQLLRARLRSIIDFDELSNKGRIHIWKETLKSISQNPILGVGIGNFPVVLQEDIALAKAGSTAHNLYLNIAAEMGIVALAVFLYILKILYSKLVWLLKSGSASGGEMVRQYALWALVYLGWVFLYSMTDAVLFDERTLLLFGINAALISGLTNRVSARGGL